MGGGRRGASITWSGRGWSIRRAAIRRTSTLHVSMPPSLRRQATRSTFTSGPNRTCWRWCCHCQRRLGSFEIEAVRRVGLENIVVLRKHGELVVEPIPAAEIPRARACRARSGARELDCFGEVPFVGVAVRTRHGFAQAHWSVDPDGVPGRTLVQTAGSVVSVPLRLTGTARFSARARLLPHDWRDGVGAVRAWVAVAHGRRH